MSNPCLFKLGDTSAILRIFCIYMLHTTLGPYGRRSWFDTQPIFPFDANFVFWQLFSVICSVGSSLSHFK